MAFTVKYVSGLPSTYEGWVRKWEARKRQTGRIVIKADMAVHRTHRGFEVSYRSGRFALITPEWTQLWANGHDSSPSTVNLFDSVCPSKFYRHHGTPAFHTRLRVNGYPFFDGIRVLPDGTVHPEDIRPDIVTKTKPEVVKRYVVLMRFIKTSLRLRWEIGEFADAEIFGCANHFQAMGVAQHTLARVEALIGSKEGAIIPHEDAVNLMTPILTIPSNVQEYVREGWDVLVDALRQKYRDDFYRANKGYYDEEVPSV